MQSFSPRFAVDFEYSAPPAWKEFLVVRVFSYDQLGLTERARCSDDLPAELFFNARRDALQIRLHSLHPAPLSTAWNGQEGDGKENSMNNSTEMDPFSNNAHALLDWQAPEDGAPPECAQFVHCTSQEFVFSRWVSLVSERVWWEVKDMLTCVCS